MQEREFIPAHIARQRGLLDAPARNEQLTFRAILDDAIRYWELRRIGYNLILTIIVLIVDLAGCRGALIVHELPGLIVLAVLANVCYCAGYVPDVLIQLSSFRSLWLKVRPLLFGAGTLFAALVAYQCLYLLFDRSRWG